MLPLALLAATSVAFAVSEPPAAVALSGERVLWASPAQARAGGRP